MAFEVDYLPVAVVAGANVDGQAAFAGSTYQASGVQTGNASSSGANKMWRQSSVMAAALANLISQTLQTNVLDDGNVVALVSLLEQTIVALGASSSGSYQGQINTLNSEVATLNSEVATINGEINTLNGQVTTLQGAKITGSESNVTSARSFNTSYTNNSGSLMILSGYGGTPGGSNVGNINVTVNGSTIYANEATATQAGGNCGFFAAIPAGAAYAVNVSGGVSGVEAWYETAVR